MLEDLKREEKKKQYDEPQSNWVYSMLPIEKYQTKPHRFTKQQQQTQQLQWK